jgi:TonB family protein
MQCPKCGNERRPEDATCRYCGKGLTVRRAGTTRSPIRVLFPIALLGVLAISFLTLGPLRQLSSRSVADSRSATPPSVATPGPVEPKEIRATEPRPAPAASSQTATPRRADTTPSPRREPATSSPTATPPAAAAPRASAGQPARRSPGDGTPVRVGGNIKPPRKTRDVRPVYPATAIAARVQGIVIIEATIAPDGEVSDARVLRSVPLLDQAALDAVLQWTYEPTFVNGVAVPVLAAVTVTFSLK